MPRLSELVFVLWMACAGSSYCAEGLAPDPVKYPQDTPEKALASAKKVLEADDVIYWLQFILTQADAKGVMSRYSSIKGYQESKARIEEHQKLLEEFRQVSSRAETESGTSANGAKWYRIMIDEKRFVMFELAQDGRWCFNPRARTKGIK